MTTARVAPRDRLTAAKLWLPAVRELEARVPSRVEDLCARAGLSRDAFEDPRRRVALAAATRLLRDASRLTKDPLFGLTAGRRHARESFDVFMRMLLAQPDSATAMDVAQRYASLPIDGLEVSYLPAESTLRVGMSFEGEPLADADLVEYVIGVISALVDDAEDERLRLLEIEFAHAPRAERRLYREATSAEVRFESGRTSFVLPHVNIPLRGADPLLATLLVDHAATVLESIPVTRSHRERLAAFVLGRLDDETLGIEDVAAAFGMSARTLRRRLELESTTFAEVLDSARRERALELLRDPDRTVAEVAVAVGFASPGAFRRAFQRWTGTNASRHRSQL